MYKNRLKPLEKMRSINIMGIAVFGIILFSSTNLGYCKVSKTSPKYQRIDTLKVLESIKANYALFNKKATEFRIVKKTIEDE